MQTLDFLNKLFSFIDEAVFPLIAMYAIHLLRKWIGVSGDGTAKR